MPTINTPASAHTAPLPNSGFEWQAVADHHELHVIRQAIWIIDHRIKGFRPCNDAFAALPGGRTFDEVWADASVFISRDPSNAQGNFGATLSNDITITRFSLRMGRWTVAATLVHELAHVNGAPGTDAQAEDTLLSCLMRGLHDSTIIGMMENMRTSTSTGGRYA